MKTKIMLTLVKSEYFDTGHEIEDLSMLSGCRIVSVEDVDQESVVLTIDDAATQVERHKIVRAKRLAQQAKHKIKRSCSSCRYNCQCGVGMKCQTSSLEKWQRA